MFGFVFVKWISGYVSGVSANFYSQWNFAARFYDSDCRMVKIPCSVCSVFCVENINTDCQWVLSSNPEV